MIRLQYRLLVIITICSYQLLFTFNYIGDNVSNFIISLQLKAINVIVQFVFLDHWMRVLYFSKLKVGTLYENNVSMLKHEVEEQKHMILHFLFLQNIIQRQHEHTRFHDPHKIFKLVLKNLLMLLPFVTMSVLMS